MASDSNGGHTDGGEAVALTVVALAIVALAGVPAVGLGNPGGGAILDGPVAQTGPEADAISLRADLAADGTARWQVTYRIELDGDNETAAFEDLRAAIEGDPTPYVERFRDRMVRTATAAENATGRAMAVENVTVSASRESLPQGEYGVVTYRLDWQGFAAVDGDRLRAGDAIDRFFLDERTSLTIAWPQAYGLESVRPTATATDDGSVTWQGRRDFGPGEPRVEVVRGETGGGESTGGTGLPLLPLGLVGVLVLAAVALVYARRRRRQSGSGTGADGAPDLGDDGAGGQAGAGTAASTTDDGPPPELLSNEERVLRLLEDEGGRLKQQQVAGRLDWTDAKTSQVVGNLRDADKVESFRLGRENVLTLPDVSIEPDADDGESE